MATASGIAYGLEHAPRFTINLLHALLFEAATKYQARIEDEQFARRLADLMSRCGPWQYGAEAASQSRASVERLPAADPGVTLLDPYYFDHSMIYTDDSYREGNAELLTYAYRLHPCGVFAMNFGPQQDGHSILVQSVVCIAFLRGTDLWGSPLIFSAMWQEGLPLGRECAFQIPRWGTLRRALEMEGEVPMAKILETLCKVAIATGGAIDAEVKAVVRRCMGDEALPTPVERGFPNLKDTVWFGSEPFPPLDFELQLIGADFRQRRESVPTWLRAPRGPLG
jgi:hypothetical protein